MKYFEKWKKSKINLHCLHQNFRVKVCESTKSLNGGNPSFHLISQITALQLTLFQLFAKHLCTRKYICVYTINMFISRNTKVQKRNISQIMVLQLTLFQLLAKHLCTRKYVYVSIYGRKSADRTKPEFDVIFIGCFRTLFR